jgi:sugar O-acyltransferase (sialic acid O-acetyltransferase NeuD family)
MEKVILFGSGNIARQTFFSLKYHSDYEIVGFTVDREYLKVDSLFQLPVVPLDDVQAVFPPDNHKMLIAVGYQKSNKIREGMYFQAKKMSYELITFASRKAIVYPETRIGDNCFIGHFTTICGSARIGNNVIIGDGCTIGHDVVVGDHCFLSSDVSIAGNVSIGSHCYLGIHSTIRNGISIGKECVIGAGAIILENTKDRSVYVGEPATLLPISSDKLPLA